MLLFLLLALVMPHVLMQEDGDTSATSLGVKTLQTTSLEEGSPEETTNFEILDDKYERGVFAKEAEKNGNEWPAIALTNLNRALRRSRSFIPRTAKNSAIPDELDRAQKAYFCVWTNVPDAYRILRVALRSRSVSDSATAIVNVTFPLEAGQPLHVKDLTADTDVFLVGTLEQHFHGIVLLHMRSKREHLSTKSCEFQVQHIASSESKEYESEALIVMEDLDDLANPEDEKFKGMIPSNVVDLSHSNDDEDEETQSYSPNGSVKGNAPDGSADGVADALSSKPDFETLNDLFLSNVFAKLAEKHEGLWSPTMTESLESVQRLFGVYFPKTSKGDPMEVVLKDAQKALFCVWPYVPYGYRISSVALVGYTWMQKAKQRIWTLLSGAKRFRKFLMKEPMADMAAHVEFTPEDNNQVNVLEVDSSDDIFPVRSRTNEFYGIVLTRTKKNNEHMREKVCLFEMLHEKSGDSKRFESDILTDVDDFDRVVSGANEEPMFSNVSPIEAAPVTQIQFLKSMLQHKSDMKPRKNKIPILLRAEYEKKKAEKKAAKKDEKARKKEEERQAKEFRKNTKDAKKVEKAAIKNQRKDAKREAKEAGGQKKKKFFGIG